MPVCAQCSNDLTLTVEDDFSSDDEPPVDGEGSGNAGMQATKTIPDDVHLPCNCHFHWQCLLDSYELDKCPDCGTTLLSSPAQPSTTTASPTQQIIVNLNNEGGLQQGIDIFPILKEESYLRAYPEERKCRAFLEFCREGDYRAIVDLLHGSGPSEDDDDDDDDEADIGVDEMMAEDDDGGDVSSPALAASKRSTDEILRYQDPIGDMQSGLHAAAANGHRDVAWMLLLLASELPEVEFPAVVFQEAAALGVMRGDQRGKVDIRGLRDAFGRTAEDVAKETGVVWTGWIGKNWLALP